MQDLTTPVVELELDLELVDTDSSGVQQYDMEVPCFLMRSILSDEELDYFLLDEQVEESLPVYFDNGTSCDPIGFMMPTTENIIIAKFLKIIVAFVNTDGEVRDFSKLEDYIGFIHI